MLVGSVSVISLTAAVLICLLYGGEGITWLWLLPVSFLGVFLLLALLAFLFLWAVCAVVDTAVPQEHDSPFYRKITYLYADAVCTILRMRIHTEGLENTPQDGRFLLVCNHLFDLDAVVLYSCFKKSQLAFISKRENTEMFLVGKLMHRLMCQLINRENDREALKTILRCIQLIKDDEVSIAVFPEGYCSKDGRLQHLRSGALKIATKANVPIAVCTIQNTNKVVRNILRLKPTDIYLHLVEVIPAEEVKGKTAVDVGNRVFKAMLTDMGPEYTPLDMENAE